MDEYFLVCGLGRLGQSCIVALKKFGVKVIGIQQKRNNAWEVDNLPHLLEDLIIGDCRQSSVLKKAKIEQCRAALLTTSDEQVNIITALAIRQLHPSIRLVIRSDQENLNQLLSEQIGNVVTFEPTQLPATAFALGGLGSDTLGFFTLDRQRLQVMQKIIAVGDNWAYSRPLADLNTQNRRILAHISQDEPFPTCFHTWEGQTQANVGDTLVYVESADRLVLVQAPPETLAKNSPLAWPKIIRKKVKNFIVKNYRQKFGKIALISGGIVLILLFFGTILLRFHFRDEGITLPWVNAFLTALVLLLGGYSDVFNPSPDEETPNWLRFFSIASTIAGTIFVGIIYALLTETLLASRFEFLKKRPPIPEKDHVVVIGLGKMGQEVASLLEDFRQPLVGVSFNTDLDRTILPKMPLIVGKEEEVLAQANLEKAKSVVITTDDDIVNLEIALMSRKINAKCPLVIRASGQALGEALPNILPNANVVNPYLVSAAAFAGAAFGENIIDIFQFNQQTILVTEYDVEAGDTLNGLLVSEVAYGYGVVPLLLQKPPESSKLMPSDDLSLTVGDRLIVLATTDGLQRIEKGRTAITPKKWRIRVDSAASQEAIFEGGNALMLISGCPPAQARELMQNLPGILPTPLYKPQAERLVRALSKARVQAELLSL